MTTEQLRQELIKMYPNSSTWPEKVKRMSEGAVFATYQSIINRRSKKK